MGFKHGVNFLTVLAMLGVRELLSACSFRGLAKVSGTQNEEEFLGRLRAELQGTRFIYNRVPREANVIFLGSLP